MSSPITEIARHKAESADTRCLILQVAERLFREIGYRKTTVADIAKSLRMSSGNLYRFFESKSAINEAVAERLIACEFPLRRRAPEPALAPREVQPTVTPFQNA